MNGVDPLVDFACKKLLGSPEHPAITLHFLNAVLGGYPLITDVEILNPIVEKEFENDKYAILDIRARNASGERFNIEIQRTRPAGLPERLTYYASSQLIEQLGSGQSYTMLRPSIGICILNAILFPSIDNILSDFRLVNARSGQVLSDHLQIHLLELPKYDLLNDNGTTSDVPITDPIEQWCYFFRSAEQIPADELLRRLRNPVFTEATGVLEMISRDPDQRRLYEDRLKCERDVQAKEEFAHQRGLLEGLEQGLERGLEQGIEKGFEKGIERGLERGEIVGKIKLLTELLGDTVSSDEDFKQASIESLKNLQEQLQRRLRERPLE